MVAAFTRVAPQNKNEQFTPVWVANFSRNVFGEEIELDPTSCLLANEVIQARRIWTIEDDALAQSWAAKSVFFNPPYGSRLIPPMINKFVEELPNIDQAIVLVNSSTSTRWYQALMRRCDVFLMPNSRINFWSAEGCPTSPIDLQSYRSNPPGGNRYDQTIFYFGGNAHRFVDHGKAIGSIALPVPD